MLNRDQADINSTTIGGGNCSPSMVAAAMFFLIVIQFACAPAVRIVREPSNNAKPAWVEKLPESDNIRYFAGSATYSGTLEEGQTTALKDAMSKIKNHFGGKIETAFKANMTEIEQKLKQQITGKSSVVVFGTKVEDSYFEKIIRSERNIKTARYDVYVLLSFSEKEIAKKIDRNQKEKQEKVRTAYDDYLKGGNSEGENKYYDARKLYRKALALITDIDGAVALDRKKVKDSKELRLKLESRLQAIKKMFFQTAISVEVKGTDEEQKTFLAKFNSALENNGFTVNGNESAIEIVGEIFVRQSKRIMRNYVYYVEGNISALRAFDRKKIAVYPLQVKGFHRSRERAILNALSEAGIVAGNGLAKMILKKEETLYANVSLDGFVKNTDRKENRKSKDTTPPEIIITSHRTRGIKIVEKNRLTVVSGIAKDESEIANLAVNYRKVRVDENGVFRTDIELESGRNQIVVSATDIFGNMARKTFTIIKEGSTDTTAKYEAGETGKYFALIIGNNDYIHLPKLKTAQNDALEIERILKQKYGFETKILLNVTRNEISRAFNVLTKTLRENDNFLIYYAGHGIYDESGRKAYWLPIDALKDDDTEWIIVDDITTKIRRTASRHILVVADSCFSGTMTRGLSVNVGSNRYLQKMFKKPSRTLMASGGNEPVSDSGGAGHSIFAESFIKGLAEIEKDVFTAEQLYYEHIKERVAGSAEQTPEYNVIRNSGHEGGDFVFRRVD